MELDTQSKTLQLMIMITAISPFNKSRMHVTGKGTQFLREVLNDEIYKCDISAMTATDKAIQEANVWGSIFAKNTLMLMDVLEAPVHDQEQIEAMDLRFLEHLKKHPHIIVIMETLAAKMEERA
jgi:hypothetical protein